MLEGNLKSKKTLKNEHRVKNKDEPKNHIDGYFVILVAINSLLILSQIYQYYIFIKSWDSNFLPFNNL